MTVSDSGPGIPANEREKVLSHFIAWRLAARLRENGLGLRLVAAIAKWHRPDIGINDNAPGLCVTVSFPASSSLFLEIAIVNTLRAIAAPATLKET